MVLAAFVFAAAVTAAATDPNVFLAEAELRLGADGEDKTVLNLNEVADRHPAIKALHDGVGAKDPAEQVRLYARSAEGGVRIAQYFLATHYYTGEGVAKDVELAMRWLRKAAEGGLPLAQFKLGDAYLIGTSVKRDVRQALRWMRRAAEGGRAQDIYQAALELPVDEAVPFMRLAAEAGHPRAALALGMFLANGKGGRPNKTEAYAWILLSKEAGDPDAPASLRNLEPELTPVQIEAAYRRAVSLRKRFR